MLEGVLMYFLIILCLPLNLARGLLPFASPKNYNSLNL